MRALSGPEDQLNVADAAAGADSVTFVPVRHERSIVDCILFLCDWAWLLVHGI